MLVPVYLLYRACELLRIGWLCIHTENRSILYVLRCVCASHCVECMVCVSFVMSECRWMEARQTLTSKVSRCSVAGHETNQTRVNKKQCVVCYLPTISRSFRQRRSFMVLQNAMCSTPINRKCMAENEFRQVWFTICLYSCQPRKRCYKKAKYCDLITNVTPNTAAQ